MWNWKILAAKKVEWFNLDFTPHFANTILSTVFYGFINFLKLYLSNFLSITLK